MKTVEGVIVVIWAERGDPRWLKEQICKLFRCKIECEYNRLLTYAIKDHPDLPLNSPKSCISRYCPRRMTVTIGLIWMPVDDTYYGCWGV